MSGVIGKLRRYRWLAACQLLALLCQIFASLGHVHAAHPDGEAHHVLAAQMALANHSAPGDRQGHHHEDDHDCTTCRAIALLGSSLSPDPIEAPKPALAATALAQRLTTPARWTRDHHPARARAPPLT